MLTTPDFSQARDVMVDGQLRPTKITHPLVLQAMRRLPREDFVTAGKRAVAYIDDDLELAPNRYMMRPLAVAGLVQLANPAPGERALVIGAGTGYLAAVLAACGAAVTAFDENADLLAIARDNLALMPGVSLVEGRLADGPRGAAPFDLIIIEGAVRAVPPQFGRLLAARGRVVTVMSKHAGQSFAVTATLATGHLGGKPGDGFSVVPAFDVFAHLLVALLPTPVFAL